MSHYYEPSVSLHQQDGGLSLQVFAAQQGISENYLRRLIKRGLVLGASKHPLSKKWCIYPPARIADGSCLIRPTIRKPREAAACQTVEKLPGVAQATPDEGENFPRDALGSVEVVDVGISPHGLSANRLQPVQETREGSGNRSPAKRGFNPFGGFAGGGDRQAENVYRNPEIRRVLQSLHEAAIRQHREGIHYLRLDSREFSQLYAALAQERSRIRKLAGKGLVDVGNLRASDSVWQKLQAMCHEGRLL